MAHGVVFNTE